MSLIAFWGAVELGLVYAFVAVGVYLAFRVLDFPDLTVDGITPRVMPPFARPTDRARLESLLRAAGLPEAGQ